MAEKLRRYSEHIVWRRHFFFTDTVQHAIWQKTRNAQPQQHSAKPRGIAQGQRSTRHGRRRFASAYFVSLHLLRLFRFLALFETGCSSIRTRTKRKSHHRSFSKFYLRLRLGVSVSIVRCLFLLRIDRGFFHQLVLGCWCEEVEHDLERQRGVYETGSTRAYTRSHQQTDDGN